MEKIFSLLSLAMIFFFTSCNDSNDNYSDRTHISEVKKNDFNSKVMIVNEIHKFKKETILNSARIMRIESSMEDSRDL